MFFCYMFSRNTSSQICLKTFFKVSWSVISKFPDQWFPDLPKDVFQSFLISDFKVSWSVKNLQRLSWNLPTESFVTSVKNYFSGLFPKFFRFLLLAFFENTVFCPTICWSIWSGRYAAVRMAIYRSPFLQPDLLIWHWHMINTWVVSSNSLQYL